MFEFTGVLGNKKNIEYLSRAAESGKLSHSFIISGEKGSGKKTLVNFIADSLLCMREHKIAEGACGRCEACIKLKTGNHPDVVRVTHEKPSVLSIDEIRSQVIDDIQIKPFYGPYKIYIIDDAQLMNDHGQNALLKTIEEPPEYALIFLLVSNEEILLDTIRSRCITLKTEALPDHVISDAIMKMYVKSAKEAAEIAAFSAGNLGKAKMLCESEGLAEMKEQLEALLQDIEETDAINIYKEASVIDKDKEKISTDIPLEIIQKWYASILFAKEGSAKNYFPKYRNMIISQARRISYEGINLAFEGVKEAKERLAANVKAEAVFENLFLLARRSFK